MCGMARVWRRLAVGLWMANGGVESSAGLGIHAPRFAVPYSRAVLGTAIAPPT